MNIVLIGYRCSGKTEVGKILARKLGWPFVDTDQRVEDHAGLSIHEIVSRFGWEGFRALEARAVRDVCTRDGQVIATGGGAVLDPQNVVHLRRNGWVVWLQADAEEIRRRMRAQERLALVRPSLSGKDALDEIEAVLLERIPFYESAADEQIDTSSLAVEDVVNQILERQLKWWGGAHNHGR